MKKMQYWIMEKLRWYVFLQEYLTAVYALIFQ